MRASGAVSAVSKTLNDPAHLFLCEAEMPDLRWTLPVASWSSTTTTAPKLDFIDPMVRRRLSALSKMALSVAHDCAHARPEVRLVFASRHGELQRTTAILNDIEAREPVSPNAFSLSVLNAMSGIYGIARHDRSPATAVAAGAQTLGYALLEAHAQYSEDPSTPVLVVYADVPADPVYGSVEQEVTQGAVAILIDAKHAPLGHLDCAVMATNAALIAASSATSSAAAHVTSPADPDAAFATQSEALQRCLESGRPTMWHDTGSTWHWGWSPVADAREINGLSAAHERGQHAGTV